MGVVQRKLESVRAESLEGVNERCVGREEDGIDILRRLRLLIEDAVVVFEMAAVEVAQRAVM